MSHTRTLKICACGAPVSTAPDALRARRTRDDRYWTLKAYLQMANQPFMGSPVQNTVWPPGVWGP
jgi:hypothetical protein